ncbi:DNA sulfur modification protein DndD [Dehalogenimonas formicexedens]|uniref:Nuclease SbcCD subunit C n=1 Tax=Dehalogenimonas formicexedens TaxID=1839801 RepID=A0A1P8F5B1_9CHLR|nr:AAA family ATPase [Dehalogenimonas formicexedens]APV43669.1 DNA sulfur modification protein DndD [Dehalogenimonas formicexedens]
MLLKSLKLRNFRQFRGDQTVYFSVDPEKNVTVIMGVMGSGKTTFAQAFTWCLYGDTDFEDKSMLCKATASAMLPNTEETVKAELALEHNGVEYTIIREQRYQKDGAGIIKRPNQPIFVIAYKNKDGQREYVDELKTEMTMKELLPKELSRYFFFDGERIGTMSKELRKGKSQEFAQAVKGLLGLSAIAAALDHLKGRGPKASVLRNYDESYDTRSDNKIAQYTREIQELNDSLSKIESRIEEIDKEDILARDKCAVLEEKIKLNEDSIRLAKEKDTLKIRLQSLILSKATNTSSLLKFFNLHAPSYFSKKLMRDALQQLSEAQKLDKGIPDIHARTIEYLIKRGICLCDNKIEFGNPEYKALNKVLEFIPPQSLGSTIGQFVRDCELKSQQSNLFYENVAEKYALVRENDNDYSSTEEQIVLIETKLQGMINVGELQKDLMKYEKALRDLQSERDNLNREKGRCEMNRDRRNTERNELSLKDENNRKIEIYKAYAQYMYNILSALYTEKEAETREQLEYNVNHIFKTIYNGGLSLSIDEKYNIQINAIDCEGYHDEIEASMGQSISVIFAFISGVTKMARQRRASENELVSCEPYPLVMDAPLSSFDKTRIKTVCDVLPQVAEQVIFFIKDTDGELAEAHMASKVGKRYLFDKKNEYETYLITR